MVEYVYLRQTCEPDVYVDANNNNDVYDLTDWRAYIGNPECKSYTDRDTGLLHMVVRDNGGCISIIREDGLIYVLYP